MKHRIQKIIFLCVSVLTLLFSVSACSGNTPQPKTTATTAAPPDGPISGGGSEIAPESSTSPDSEATSDTEVTSDTEAASDTEMSSDTEVSSDPGTTAESETTVETDLILTLATLNIKHGAEGLDTVAEAIREVSPDIIGLEEVDVNCERSGFVDEPKELSRLAGYPYYAFSKAINLGDGEYGTAILSRYPIESFEVIPLESGNGEDRTLGHAVISIANQKVDVFVTHLSFEDRSLRIEQMDTISDNLGNSKHYILLGDFNSFDLEDVMYLGGFYYVNRPDRRYTTFRRYDLAIDNIIVSRSFTELSSALSDRECSDHKLLYASFQFTP